ncbi:hypothetical protein PTTG_27758 [Puccinia triticina 1-1 BBBD Race 1]|uniref:Uncharacterized protein n=1 Tax=Puccinia triticina (isolate 1-1 / race 1 (BBBD)) TaxID=630390 RepID=A0A180GI82_PUCT1|nr:hypothetical protein PTTG_27758 [Puccinia triticina 1-1 BBBD Race 1]
MGETGETSPPSKASDTVSAPQPKIGSKSLEPALLPVKKGLLRFPERESLQLHTGIRPALFNARATSLTSESNRFTSAPHPVDWETHSEQLPKLSLHLFAPSPLVDNSSHPMEDIQEESKVTSLVNLFTEYFELSPRARGAQHNK